METIVIHLKLVRGGVPLMYVVQYHIKVSYILPGCGTYLNLNEEMIVRASIVDAKSNPKLTQECLDRIYLSCHCDTFKIDNALVYQILLKVFTDIDVFVYMK